jgi:hypothetical protein
MLFFLFDLRPLFFKLVLKVILLLGLASGPLWPGISHLLLDEGELQSHQLVYGVGRAHLPTLLLLMAGVQWILRDWIEGLVVLL